MQLHRTISGPQPATDADIRQLTFTSLCNVCLALGAVTATTEEEALRMSRTTTFLLATGALALGAAAFAGASLADGGWGRHHGWGDDGGMEFFERFDGNQDGRLTQAEVDEVRRSQLTEFDQDSDGSLTLEEYQALWLDAMRERMVDRFQAHDDDGDGMVTVEEFSEPFDRMVSRLDANDDGALTPDEMHHRGERRGDRERDRESGDEDE
jgi:Ca2+-binding EF-hand superfamily protein